MGLLPLPLPLLPLLPPLLALPLPLSLLLSPRLRPVLPPRIFSLDPLGVVEVEEGVGVAATFAGFFRPLTKRRRPLRMSPRVARPYHHTTPQGNQTPPQQSKQSKERLG